MHFISENIRAAHELPMEITTHDIEISDHRSEAPEPFLIKGDRLRRRVLQEPLVHFLLAGLFLCAAASLFERSTGASTGKGRIQVSAPEIQRLCDVWTRQRGRTPNPKEMQNLVDEYVREEILYREALSAGLDKDDTIVRRRLVEKMEFLSQEFASAPPSEQELGTYFQANREHFRIPAEIAFSHIYFSVSKRGLNAETHAKLALVAASSKKISASKLSSLGDAFMLQNEYPLETEQQIKELFGSEFAAKLFQLEPGKWSGPLRSGYGFHLVLVQQKLSSRIPELAEVRNQVLSEFQNRRLQKASDDFYAEVRRRYQVDIDHAALARVGSSPKQSKENKPSEHPELRQEEGQGAD